MGLIEDCRELSDADLTRDLRFLAQRDHHCLAKLLAHLAEFDRRQLCAEQSGSLFNHCVHALGYDEFDAYRRIRAARTVRRFPAVLELIEKGRLSLTAIVVLHPHLTPDNARAWFAVACGKSRRQLEVLVAARHPQDPRPDSLRRFPAGGASLAWSAPPQAVDVLPNGGPSATAAPALHQAADAAGAPPLPTGDASPEPGSRPHEWQAMVPISLDRVRIGFDAGIAVMSLIDRARQILRHKYPAGRLEDLVKEALELLLDRKDPQRRLTLKPAPVVRDAAALPADAPRFLRARAAGRYIPAWVKRAAWERDGGRCAWREADGTVCGSKDWLEYDHLRPFAKGGRSDSPRNVRLLCRAHNAEAARAAGLSAAAPAS